MLCLRASDGVDVNFFLELIFERMKVKKKKLTCIWKLHLKSEFKRDPLFIARLNW